MRTHYCKADRDWITFEGTCSWCGLNEDQIGTPMTDEDFRKLMDKLNASANPNITDD